VCPLRLNVRAPPANDRDMSMDARNGDRRGARMLRRLAAISARPVAAGGESGPWRWLVPALVVGLLLFVGQRVADLGGRADRAEADAALAQRVSADVVERSALVTEVWLGRQARRATIRHLSANRVTTQRRLAALRNAGKDELELDLLAFRLEQSDRDIDDLVRRLRRDDVASAALLHRRKVVPRLRQTLEIGQRIERDAARRAGAARATARRASALMLGLGSALALLLLWVFWSRRSASQVALHERRFRSLVQNSSDLIVVVDHGGVVTECTPVVEQMLGRRAENLLGTPFAAIVHPDDVEALTGSWWQPADGATTASAWRAHHAAGEWVDVESTCTDLREDTSVGGHVLVVRDVRERKAFEERLHHQAFYDALTGLPNRVLFEDRVTHAVARARRSGDTIAVLFVDLDDFKTVNDSLGHAAGDDLLRQTAARIDECLRGADTAARLGGDEFAVLVEGVEAAEHVTAVAERLHAALDRPFTIGQDEIFVRASIGIALQEEGQLDDELLRNADTAMYAAKAAGKGRHELFRPVMHATAKRRLQLTGDLRRAVENQEFTVDYQPLVSLADGRILGAEALVRWEHPEFGRIAPDDFIPLAEETGLIVPIGETVLREACRQAKSWQQLAGADGPAYVSVNLSPRQFRPPGKLVSDVQRLTAETGLDPSCLLLEITETVLMHDREHAGRDLQALRELGVRVAIDDFGTGYSSLSYLREFPIDIVKMDRSFVKELGRGRGDDALVRSVLELGEALDMQIVAEGIEDVAQLDSLRDLHCGIGQGYYFSEPISPERMFEVLRGADRPA
jgi:diguanylate cyclase (GGDEF)-like protein/PAS domain S-box-containing protein